MRALSHSSISLYLECPQKWKFKYVDKIPEKPRHFFSFGQSCHEALEFFYGAALALAFAYVLGFTPLGRHMRFVGASREVSRLSGVRVNRIRFGSFVAASALSGIGAVVTVAALGSYNATTSDSYLLPVFASVFLGTAVIQPGQFNPIGTWIGIYFLATGISGLEDLGLQTWVSDVFYGGVLVIAVTKAPSTNFATSTTRVVIPVATAPSPFTNMRR